MSLRVDYDERAISQATAFLDDPPGIRAALDATGQLAMDPSLRASVPVNGQPGKRRYAAIVRSAHAPDSAA